MTTFGVGSALGTAVAGPVAQHAGTSAGFAVAGASGLAALLVLAVTGRVLAVPGPGRNAAGRGK